MVDRGRPSAPAWPHGVKLCTDLANAHRLAQAHGRDLIHVTGLGWHVWRGTHWEHDLPGKRTRRRLHHALQDYAAASAAQLQRDPDDTVAKALVKHAGVSQHTGRMDAALREASALEGIAREPDDLDANPWLLSCKNGTLDLSEPFGELRPHQRPHFITRTVAPRYNPIATAPTWLAFLERIFAGNAELIGYVQRALGYSLTGDTSEQCFFLLHGDGSNGKSTLLEAVGRILGPHATTSATDTLMKAPAGRGIPNDVARLRGARMVTASESGEGRKLDEERVKRLCGGDTITARFLRREYFEFRPTFKLWLSVNNKPSIGGTDHGIWRRVRLIPYEVIIPDEEQDRKLGAKLAAEADGILAWMVEGARLWREGGLQAPPAVADATAAYRAEEDVVGRFVADRCVVPPPGVEARCGLPRLHKAYAEWAAESGEKPMSSRALSTRLVSMGFERRRTAREREIHGLGLAAEER